MKNPTPKPADGNGPRADLMRVAEQMFAERGIAGVGIREIVGAVGHKNVGSVRHHFGSKEKLVREIMQEGLRVSGEWRTKRLAELSSAEVPMTLRDVISVIIGPVREGIVSDTFMLFLTQVQLADRKLFEDVLGRKDTAGMRGCVEYLRELSKPPSDDFFQSRLALLNSYCVAYMNAQMWKRSRSGVLWRKSIGWRTPALLEHFLDTAETILLTVPSGSSATGGAKA